MILWYQSERRFTNRIKKKWISEGFKFNNGHVQLLRYAYRAAQYWANLQHQKCSEMNRIETQQKLF